MAVEVNGSLATNRRSTDAPNPDAENFFLIRLRSTGVHWPAGISRPRRRRTTWVRTAWRSCALWQNAADGARVTWPKHANWVYGLRLGGVVWLAAVHSRGTSFCLANLFCVLRSDANSTILYSPYMENTCVRWSTGKRWSRDSGSGYSRWETTQSLLRSES
jgi:hypothetical protein